MANRNCGAERIAEESPTASEIYVPPERAEKLLHFLLPTDRAEDRIGDLEEKFYRVMLPKYGHGSAVRWYWTQAALLAVERITAWAWLGAAVGWLMRKLGS